MNRMLRQSTERLEKWKKQEGMWNKNLCFENLSWSIRISHAVTYTSKTSCMISLQAY